MKLRKIFLTAVGAIVVAVTLSFATTASATADPSALSASPAAAASHAGHAAARISLAPLVQCPIVPHRFVMYRKGCQKIGRGRLCTPGFHGDITPPGWASNGCAFRVWLYPEKGEKGSPALCLRPHSATGHFKRFWLSYRVVASTKSC